MISSFFNPFWFNMEADLTDQVLGAGPTSRLGSTLQTDSTFNPVN